MTKRESGGDKDNLSAPKNDAQIVEKFCGLTEDTPGARCVSTIADRLWRLQELENMAAIAPDLVLD